MKKEAAIINTNNNKNDNKANTYIFIQNFIIACAQVTIKQAEIALPELKQPEALVPS